MSKCEGCGIDLQDVTINEGGSIHCPECRLENFPTLVHDLSSSPTASIERNLRAIGRFRLQGIAGEGGFGRVFAAWDEKLQRKVAIKIPKKLVDLDKTNFLREAQAASKLRHPSIVTIYDVGSINDTIYIVSEFIDGPPLSQWLKTHTLSFDEACVLVERICDAVACAHEQGVIHRDLKPANTVMLAENPVILDFGLSYSRSQPQQSVSGEGMRVGTPGYMAPEQVTGEMDKIGTWTDTYAIGVILYELLTRRRPFSDRSSDLFKAIINDIPPAPRSINHTIPASLQAICMKAISKAPEDRYSSASALADDLRAFRTGNVISAFDGVDPRRMKLLVRRRLMLGTIATMSVGLIGSTAWIYRRSLLDYPTQRVLVKTMPENASLTWLPFDPYLGDYDSSQAIVTEGNRLTELPSGHYRVIIRANNQQCEVLRDVPNEQDENYAMAQFVPLSQSDWYFNDGIVELATISLVSLSPQNANMIRVGAGEAKLGRKAGMLAGVTRKVGPFLIDPTEVSRDDVLAVFPRWIADDPLAEDNSDRACVSFDVAVAYAEKVGKAIPTLWEYYWAATNQGTTDYPWGNNSRDGEPWRFDPQANQFDKTTNPPSIAGLYSGMGEWTTTPLPVIRRRNTGEPSPAQRATDFTNSLAQRAVAGLPTQLSRGISYIQTSGDKPDAFGFWGHKTLHPNFGFRCIKRLSQ